MYMVHVWRLDDWGSGAWHLVGQYATRRQAGLIARDYRSRGEKARVRKDGG